MLALRHVLAPAPRLLTPERTALAAVGALAAAAASLVITSISEVRQELHGSVVAALVMVAVTVGLSVVLARRALEARSPLRARAWLLFGGFLTGSLDAATSYSGAVLLRGGERFGVHDPAGVLAGCLALGGPLGCLFGVACAPVVAAAVRARLAPSVDAGDRVLFAAGASLLVAGALGELASPSAAPPTGAIAATAGAIAAVVAAARLLVRVRLLRRARDGAEPGFHVVPRTFLADESALVPLVGADLEPSGVLAATGISAPYRGERGVFKVALAPLPDEPFGRPVVRMLGGVLGEIGRTLATVMLGALGVWMAGMLLFFTMMAVGALGAVIPH